MATPNLMYRRVATVRALVRQAFVHAYHPTVPSDFVRSPAAIAPVHELLIDTGETAVSGLLAVPPGGADPRALLVAVHGAGMHAGYFDATTAPGLSLLELGSTLGYAVWAPDRPGIGASASLPDARITLAAQATILLDAIDAFAATHAIGDGVLLVGHSYGLKLAWTMAAEERLTNLLGVDGAGSGIRYTFGWAADGTPDASVMVAGDHGPPWGPAHLYPPRTFTRASLPLHDMPAVQAAEGGRWPDDLRAIGARIRVPLRLTLAEHERFWPTDDAHLAELRAALPNAPSFTVEREPGAGHNTSLGWAARPYHLKVLAFAETCRLRKQRAVDVHSPSASTSAGPLTISPE